jgi:hypothetical protein
MQTAPEVKPALLLSPTCGAVNWTERGVGFPEAADTDVAVVVDACDTGVVVDATFGVTVACWTMLL